MVLLDACDISNAAPHADSLVKIIPRRSAHLVAGQRSELASASLKPWLELSMRATLCTRKR